MRVSLFITCLVDHFYPEAGEAMVHLLRRQGVEVAFPAGQTCCGQPVWNTGQHEEARALARHFIEVFEDSEYIVAPSGSCVGHVRYYYPQMFLDDESWRRRAEAVASRTYEFTQFLAGKMGVVDVGASFPARAVYHNGCHMTRELRVTEEPVKLLQHVRDLEVIPMDRQDLCCGFGGAFAVKLPEISTAMADEKLHHLSETKADLLIGTDAGCLMQLAGRAQRLGLNLRVMHLAEVLWQGVQRP
ncbi:MAG: (Fe-S)-binding protein [Mycobacterium leprae]